jgi:hypothetical protein
LAVQRATRKSIAKADANMRLAPDPFAAVLPALAALGAISSIASINWIAQDRAAADRSRGKRKAHMALRDLESSCIGLHDAFRRFQRYPKLFAGEGGPAAAPLKFGVHGARVDAESIRIYQDLVDHIASMFVLAAQSSYSTMSAIEDGEIDAPEKVFFGFGEQQERLNQLIAQRATLKSSVDTGLDIAVRLTALVRELKRYRIE